MGIFSLDHLQVGIFFHGQFTGGHFFPRTIHRWVFFSTDHSQVGHFFPQAIYTWAIFPRSLLKLSQNYRIYAIFQNWSMFLDWGARSAIFWYLKAGTFGKSAQFQVPKNRTLGAKTKKQKPLFNTNIPQKWWETRLFYAFNTFGF